MILLQELGYLALAIVQAGAYICKSGCSLSQYSEMYGERRAMFLEEYQNHVQKIDDYEWTVYTTWTVSFEKLSTQASTFLTICSFFHHDGIPAEMFRKASSSIMDFVLYDSQGSKGLAIAKEFLSSFRTEDGVWDPHKFLTVMTEIRSYSLIDSDKRNEIYSIHPLVHSWTRTRVLDVSTIHECSQYVLGMSIEWKFESVDLTFRRMLLPHVNASLQDRLIPEMATSLSLVFYESGHWKRTEELAVESLDMMKRVLGDEHPDTLSRVRGVAVAHQGRLKEAEELMKMILRRKFLSGQHFVLATDVMGDLALLYMDQGRLKEAEELSVKAMVIWKQILGEEDPQMLTSVVNLSSVYSSQGRWKEAEELGVKVTETRKRVLGDDHPSTFVSMGNLATTYRNLGRWKEAEELCETVMNFRKKVLGEEHPGTIASMVNLTTVYLSQGRWKKAEEVGVKAMEMSKRVHGDEYPETLTSIANLSSVYSSQGRLKEAEELGVKLVETRKRILGDDHPSTLTSMANLSTEYSNQGRWKEAEELSETVMKTRKRVLGKEHPHTLESIKHLASTYSVLGRLKEAEELIAEVMEVSKRVRGEEHPDTLSCMSSLATMYLGQRRWKEAEQLKVVEKMKRVLGEDHPDTLITIETFRQFGEQLSR
jgi:tetratricopeptide (TPR) repeat protein